MAITRTTHGATATSATAATTIGLTVSAVTGEAIIVAVGTVNTNSNAPTDNATGSSNTYIQLGSIKTNTERITFWGCASSKSNVTTVTCTFTSSRYGIAISTYTGIAGFNQSNTTTSSGSASPATATLPNTLNPGSVAIAGFVNKGTATWSANAGGNMEDHVAGAGTTTPGAAIVDSIGLGSPQTCTVNESAGNVWAGTIIEAYSSLLTNEDEDETSFGGSVIPRIIARGAGALALAGAIFASGLGFQVANSQQDDPAGNLNGLNGTSVAYNSSAPQAFRQFRLASPGYSVQYRQDNGEFVLSSGGATATPSGQSAASGETAPIGAPFGLPSGQTSASAENNPLGTPFGLPAGQTAASAENNPIGVPAGVPAGKTAASAENNPTSTGTGNASATGDSAASAENNPLGVPAGVPAGQTAASAQNAPLGVPAGVPSGDSAASAQGSPFGAVICFPAGQTAASAENDPTASIASIAQPSGVSSASAENDPSATGTGNASVTGDSAASAENNPLGAPISLPAGLAAASAENNPSATGTGVGLPSGVSVASAEANPIGAPSGLAAGVSASSAKNNPLVLVAGVPAGQTSASSETNGQGNPTGIPSGLSLTAVENNPTANNGTFTNGTANPDGLALTAAENNPTAVVVTVAAGGSLPAARRSTSRRKPSQLPIYQAADVPNSATAFPLGLSLSADIGFIRALGSAKAIAAIRPTLLGKVGEIKAKGIRNPTDEELIAILLAA